MKRILLKFYAICKIIRAKDFIVYTKRKHRPARFTYDAESWQFMEAAHQLIATHAQQSQQEANVRNEAEIINQK